MLFVLADSKISSWELPVSSTVKFAVHSRRSSRDCCSTILCAQVLASQTLPLLLFADHDPVCRFLLLQAYIFMFLPLLLMDRRGRENLPTVTMWGLGMFLTNSMVLSYLAVRAITPTAGPPDSKSPLARPFGITGAVVFMVAIIWFFVGRPDVGGDLTERVAFFQQIITHQRASFSYLLDSALFYMAQIILIGAVDSEESSKRWLRFVPFWGLAAWLII